MPPKKKAEPTAYEAYAAALRERAEREAALDDARAAYQAASAAVHAATDKVLVAAAALEAEALKG